MFMRTALHLSQGKRNVTSSKPMIRCALFSNAFGTECALPWVRAFASSPRGAEPEGFFPRGRMRFGTF